MRVISLFLFVLLVAYSCAGLNKRVRPGTDSKAKTYLMPATPIREVEEKLVPIGDKEPDPHSYFVIIGSFRNPENARERQSVVTKEGFKPEILKNDAGLFRVSVMATDNIEEARAEVRRIWAKFPAYSDTWMLISKK